MDLLAHLVILRRSFSIQSVHAPAQHSVLSTHCIAADVASGNLSHGTPLHHFVLGTFAIASGDIMTHGVRQVAGDGTGGVMIPKCFKTFSTM
jgi:hypothetical protein